MWIDEEKRQGSSNNRDYKGDGNGEGRPGPSRGPLSGLEAGDGNRCEGGSAVTQAQNVFKELLLVLRLKGTQRSPNPGRSKIGMIKEEALNPGELHPCRTCRENPSE